MSMSDNEIALDYAGDVLDLAVKASAFANGEAKVGTQPVAAASERAHALTVIAKAIVAGDDRVSQEIKLNRARAIFALDPEGLSGGEMREEIDNINTRLVQKGGEQSIAA